MAPTQKLPPKQEALDSIDRHRLPELQHLSGYCPFSLNSQTCPHGPKCQLKKICYYLCPFRIRGTGYCDGFHDVAPMCQQFLTDKGCRYRKQDDHPFISKSHDIAMKEAMDVMLKPHAMGLYGVKQ